MFKRFIKTFKSGYKLDKSLIYLELLYSLFNAVKYILPLFYGEIILNKVVDYFNNGNGNFESIFFDATILVGVVSLSFLINSFIDRYLNFKERCVYYTCIQNIANRSFTLEYEKLIDSHNKNLIEKANEGANAGGGIGSFFNNLGSISDSLVIIIFSLIFFSKLFVENETKYQGFAEFLNSFWSGLIIIYVLFICVILNYILGKKTANKQKEFFELNIDFNRKFAYFFRLTSNYKLGKDIRIYNGAGLIGNEIEKANEKVKETYTNHTKKVTYLWALNVISNILVLFIAYLFVGLKAYYGIVLVGSIVSIVGSVNNLSVNLNKLVSLFNDLYLQLNYLSYYFDYIDQKNVSQKATHSINELSKDIVFEFKNVSFKYPNSDVYALKNVSFKLGEESKTAIVGRNGAGKSTIIKLICRFYKPESGEILINGININSFDFDEYQKMIAVVFQDFTLFGFTLLENVSCSENGDEKHAKDCLSQTEFNYKKLKNELNTYLYHNIEEGIEISGGEAQKIAIARALYKNSPFVLLDEPTNALDPKSEQEIYLLFNKLIKDKKAVYISHRMSSTKFCDEIIVLNNGKIAERGNHEDLMKKNGIYTQLFNAQSQYYEDD